MFFLIQFGTFLCISHQIGRVKSPESERVVTLRHHYAIENINRWTDEGFGFDTKLLYLSKSMGHSTLESTRYYYSLVPGMAEILEEKTGGDFENIVPEVDYEASDE